MLLFTFTVKRLATKTLRETKRDSKEAGNTILTKFMQARDERGKKRLKKNSLGTFFPCCVCPFNNLKYFFLKDKFKFLQGKTGQMSTVYDANCTV